MNSDSTPPFDVDDLRVRATAEAAEGGPRLWRSLEELARAADLDDWLAAEFPDPVRPDAVDRRTVLRLMAASLALRSLAACDDRSEVVRGAPLLSHPRNAPGYTPGVPLEFATSLELGGYGRGVLVRAQEGRPIKVEGNPLHPASLGATDVFAQAETLSLFDPDRARLPRENGADRSWEDLAGALRPVRDELVAAEGRGLHVLMPPVASPTLERLVTSARRLFPQARWYLHGPVADGSGARAGALAAFGRPFETVYDLTATDVLITLGGDLFLREPGHVRYAADYMSRRRASGSRLPRVVAVETTPSLLGAKADERLPLPPHAVERFARDLALALDVQGTMPAAQDPPHPAAARLAAELRRAGPRGLVVPGHEQPAAVHALAHAINASLGAFGTSLRLIDPILPQPTEEGGFAPIEALSAAIRAGEATHVLILGGNPVYDVPADLAFGALLRRVPYSLHLGARRDETALACRWFVPQRHPLESWGDLRAFDGTAGLRQPVTAPVMPGLSAEEMLAALVGQQGDVLALVQATWRQRWGEAAFEERWLHALEAGVIEGTAAPPASATLRADWDKGPGPMPTDGGLAVVFVPDASVWDGRFANNAWLQELPQPLTKLVWGNAALVAPATADALGLSTGDVVTLRSGPRTIEAPVWILPGHAPDALTLPLGYGRTAAGRVGNHVGFDAYALRTSEHPWVLPGVALTATGRRQDLISTQNHHALPTDSEDLVRIVAAADPLPHGQEAPRPSLYPEYAYEGHAWGMAIDLDACIGCNACVVACQAENNIPVVGPEEVARGREMHWLRIDRYHAGTPEVPRTYFQPVPCMHCEKAPCEIVCPVNATVHSAEGLNDMVYNRCIGTRTCSNNCPYKVRRFNFFDWRTSDVATPEDALNPHVSVRDRGVMEKCTYCVQRIRTGRIEARLENRRVRDGEVVTACQQACPTQAIVFGDQNDPDSAVARLKRSERNYALLGKLNTQPRTTYLARVAAAEPPRQADR